jgi:hypothetical protein
MTNHFESIAASVTAAVTLAAGSVLAQANVSDPTGGWAGPLTVTGLGIAVVTWLVARLNKSDEREVKRMERHEETIATLVELGTASKFVIEQNSKLLERVENSILKCSSQKPTP